MSISKHDWDFQPLAKATEREIIACCIYEYARESPSIIAHYEGEAQAPFLPKGFHYAARVNGVLLSLPSPLVWPAVTGSKLFSYAWQDLNPKWREHVCNDFQSLSAGAFRLPAFVSADTGRMKQEIISRGDERTGIDCESGRERAAVEIDWAFYTDAEIVDSFKKWVADNRPDKIGFRKRTGRTKATSWLRKLDNLAIMRLLHHSLLADMKECFPVAWHRFGPKERAKGKDTQDSQERELYARRVEAAQDFYELFPFLPKAEQPLSAVTKAKR